MGVRSVTFAPGEYYHIYNRGTDKRTIFFDQRDYKRFTELLFLANSTKILNLREIYRNHDSVFEFDRAESQVSIGAYCLMPNHFHILLSPLLDGSVTKFMNKLGTSYSMYFNSKNQRSGSLFQGRFKAQHVNSDEYLKYLFSYIHLNPVKLIQSDWKTSGINDAPKAYDYASNYKHSSLIDYVGEERQEGLILNRQAFPDYFFDLEELATELFDWINYKQTQL